MNTNAKKRLTYWSYQLFGWFFYGLIFCGIDAFKQGLPFNKVFPYIIFGIILILFLGVFLSHQMRRLVKKMNVLRKSLKEQFFFSLASTVLFTLLFWLLFNLVVNRAGFFVPLKGIFSGQLKYLRWFLSQYLLFSVSFLVWNLFYFIYHYIQKVKTGEQEKFDQQAKLFELEAKALRAQMNPHFIFNCLNSIKALMQEKQTGKGVAYLTTFSKLIRTLFNNADKKEISLYDEIETCKLYLQLEAMRFDAKFSYSVNVDENIDLKSVIVPALIIQPFIENSIWHGIMPKSGIGNVSLNVTRDNKNVEISVEDNGIGRTASQQNRPASSIGHQSKGVNLTQSRLELDNLLQKRQARLTIIDKIDDKGKATGTKVVIELPLES